MLPNRRASRRGNYLMTLSAFMPILIGFAALSVDISYITMSHTQAQNVADAAAHAAFVSYRATGDTAIGDAAAEFVVSKNTVGNTPATLDGVEYGEWDFDTYTFDGSSAFINSAKAAVSRTQDKGNQLDLFFAPLLGFNHADVGGESVTAGRTRQVMLITDVSCSFANDIDSARAANIAFLDYMRDNPFPNDLLGQAVFAGRKTFPLLHDLASPTDDYDSLNTAFQTLEICSRVTGPFRGSPTYSRSCYTSQARGMHYALQEFVSRGDSREFQAMILITDGQANTHLTSNRDGRYSSTARYDAELLRDLMWNGGTFNYQVWECPINDYDTSNCGLETYVGYFAGGVHLWTVYFGSSGSNVSWLQSLVDFEGNRGSAKDTDDPDNLEAIMLEIASSLPVVIAD